MEKHMQSKSYLLKNSSREKREDLDFNDVFGGPPRRFSMQEVRIRRSLSDLLAPEHGVASSPQSLRKEKLLFREASMARRQSLSDNFFDDIFRGDESYSPTMRTDRDPADLFGSNQSSGITRPDQFRPELFGTSLSPQLSLPAKLTRAMEFSTSKSQNNGQVKMDSPTNRKKPHLSSSLSFRFYHRSPLASSSSEDSSSTVTSDPKDTAENSKLGTAAVESQMSGNRFHFSIYKWAGRGVPVLTPHVERSTVKELSTNDRFSSSIGKNDGKFSQRESSKVTTNQDLSVQTEPDSLKARCEEKEKNEVNLNEQVSSLIVDKQMDESQNKNGAQVNCKTKTPSFRKSFSWESKTSLENLDDLFEDFFQVQELPDDDEKATHSEETKAIDSKIHQWSVEKKGNIRSLLSNLQFILWPGNGWKPIPLVDLIEANSVKRAYQKALLRIHPDKLQQNDTASDHKYLAEKVFDILQEAWDQFNALGPL